MNHSDPLGSSQATGDPWQLGDPGIPDHQHQQQQQRKTATESTVLADDESPRKTTDPSQRRTNVNGTKRNNAANGGASGSESGPAPKPGHLSRGKSVLEKLGLADHAALDPQNPAFDFAVWSRTVVALRKELALPSSPRSGFVFRDLTVRGSGSGVQQHHTIWTTLSSGLGLLGFLVRWRRNGKKMRTILQYLDGVVYEGELLLVLGRPGSGCSTLLKTIAGETQGLDLDGSSVLEYKGIQHKEMANEFRGDLIYNQEVDQHFPYLTVGQTLEFAAAMRTPRARLPGVTRQDRAEHVVDVLLAVFGLAHVRDTIVGDDYVRGISGGERKRVSIAEAAVAGAAVSAWDNSTRGLDAESALNFVHRLHKVSVLYQGRQVFFGHVKLASQYFEEMGWDRPARQTLGEFLTAVADPDRRRAKNGFDHVVPRTPEEFEAHWRKSAQYSSLKAEINQYQRQHPVSSVGAVLDEFRWARRQIKAKWMLPKATQTISFPMQVGLCAKRAIQQLWNAKAAVLTSLLGEMVISLVVGSIFYGIPDSTDAFFSSSSVLFFSVLLNVLMATTDSHNLYKGRAVVQKHVSYCFYHASADALAGVLVDIPWKFIMATCFNLTLYFLAGLAATASQFFTFFLFVLVATLAMSMVFRTIAAATRTLPQCMAISGLVVLALVTYTGFVLPAPDMHPWFMWILYINPLFYAFEALLVNQVHSTNYLCAGLIPSYPGLGGETFVCPVPGAVAGHTYVGGDNWLEASYGYMYSHLWRNLAILLGFLFFFLVTYLWASELNVQAFNQPDVLVFLDAESSLSKREAKGKGKAVGDIEAATGNMPSSSLVPLTDTGRTAPQEEEQQRTGFVPTLESQHTFAWQNVSLDVMVKNKSSRLLNEVSGWVRPGTLTALMGVSGAGKTTLLNALAQRVSYGTVEGDFYLDRQPLPVSFKRNVAYVQQQDVHLETATVREALQFSALLRQPASVPRSEKLASVEGLIRRMDMTEFADAVVGVPGRGLGVEQRKRLSIAVELAAKPTMLMFLDEPTSGLDGQSAEGILVLLRKLASLGLGIICTVHQPSAMLFQQFDRLLLMAKGGRVSSFGDIGPDSETVLQYFGERGPRRCEHDENPAEYLLDMLQSTEEAKYDWPALWNSSAMGNQVLAAIDAMKRSDITNNNQPHQNHALDSLVQTGSEYSLPLLAQIPHVLRRTLQQHWRSPTYVLSKYMLGIVSSLFIGFSFWQTGLTIMNIQSAMFSILMICAVFSALVQQIMPQFLMQRTLYEVRERHSNMYSWAVLLLSNMLAEIPYNIVLGVVVFSSFNYTVFGIRSAEDQGLVLLFFIYFYVFAGTFAHMIMAPLPDVVTASGVVTIMFSMMVLFAGLFQTPADLPGFWIFMYRASPLTYLVGGIAATSLSGRPIVCSPSELVIFQPPEGQTCGGYMSDYLDGSNSGAVGTLLNPESRADCSYCPVRSADQVLARSWIYYDDRWFDWALGFAYVGFNIVAVFLLYYLFRLGKLKAGIKKVSELRTKARRRGPH